jgi:putative tryptophan/tyrosine transport system substrate-binding protein
MIDRPLALRAGMIALLLLGALAGSRPAVAASALARPVRIGVLFPDTPSARAPMLEAFRQGLQELGYVDGQGVILDVRYAENREERLGSLAMELVTESVDVLVAGGTTPTAAAQLATRTIPIVMVGVCDPVARGFVASLHQPGGNITGSSDARPDALATRLQLLKDVLPSAAQVALIHNGAVASLTDAQAAARRLGLTLQPLDVRVPSALTAAMVTIRRTRPDALIVVPNPLTYGSRHSIASVGLLQQVPVLFGWREFMDADGLMAYGANLSGLYRRAGAFVDKIIKGTPPGALPVELPRFELVINLRTAKALGIRIPPDVLSAADEVIQ